MKSASKLRKTATRKEWVRRWCPPKPLVGVLAIEKILNRHTFVACQESRLIVAVIAYAIQDCLNGSYPCQRQEARRFILGSDLQLWCDLVDLHPDFVRFVARKAGYLASEDQYWQFISVKVVMLPKPVENTNKSAIHSMSCH